ncbi:MAG: HEAT repeat domain-containing protein [Planctomycetota bacterium]
MQALVEALGSASAESAKQTLRDLGEPVTPYLLAAVRSSRNGQVLDHALALLAQQACTNPAGKAGDFFVALDQESDPILVASALGKLSGTLPERLWPTLQKLARSELAIIKKPLIAIMARRGDAASAEFVQRMMDDPDESVRSRAVAIGIDTLPEPEAVALARKVFEQGDGDAWWKAQQHVMERRLIGGCVAALQSRVTRVSAWALQSTRSDTQPHFDLAALTPEQKRAVVEPVLRTLRDATLPSKDVEGVLKNSNLLSELPFTAADLLPLARERGGEVARRIAMWIVYRLDQPGAFDALLTLGDEAWLAPSIVGSFEQQHAALNHRVALALCERHGWHQDWTRGALECLLREWDETSAAACRAILAQPDAELKKLFGVVSAIDRHTIVRNGLSPLAPETDALIDRLGRGAIVPVAEIVEALPSGPELLQHGKVIELLCRVYEEPNDDVVRLRAMHLLRTTGSQPLVLERLLAPIAFPIIQEERHWMPYQDELPELKGRHDVGWVEVRDAELRAMMRVAFAAGDSLIADLERFLAAANASTRDHLSSDVLARVTDVVLSERPALRTAWQTRLLTILDHPANDEFAGAWAALRRLHQPAALPDEILARLLESADDRVVLAALGRVAEPPAASHRGRIEALLGSSPNADVRIKAAEVLATCADSRSIGLLTEALRDRHEGVRSTAKKGLDMLHVYLDERARWEQFDAGGPAALNPLTALLKQTRDPEKKVRLAAIRALGALGDPAALPHVIELLKDQDRDIQSAAEKALDALAAVHRSGS